MKRKNLYVVTFHPDNIGYEVMYICGLQTTYLSRHSTLLGVKNEMVKVLQDEDSLIKSVIVQDINDHSFVITFDYLDKPDKRYICEYLKMTDTQTRKQFANVFVEMDGFGKFVSGRMMVYRNHSKLNMC